MNSSTSTRGAPDRVALVTGGSRGLGRALVLALVREGWHVITDGRDAATLRSSAADVPVPGALVAVPGDVTDPEHRRALAAAVSDAGGLDLLVNNASELGPSPQPELASYPLADLEHVFLVNAVAPLALFQLVLPHLREGGRVINITSDAAVEPYQGWGGYGSSKAALDQISAILGAEHPRLRVYAFDPGDMRTDMHQLAFPGEDISDRPAPESVIPSLLLLIDATLPSGRYRASDVATAVTA